MAVNVRLCKDNYHIQCSNVHNIVMKCVITPQFISIDYDKKCNVHTSPYLFFCFLKQSVSSK